MDMVVALGKQFRKNSATTLKVFTCVLYSRFVMVSTTILFGITLSY